MTTLCTLRLIATLILATASGCITTATLTFTETAPVDRTSPKDCYPGFRSLMILRGKGSERGSMGELIGLEARFLDNHVQLISSAITGRVIQGTDERAGQAAALSDVERALVLARESNAEALLQVELMEDEESKRYFIEDGGQLKPTENLVPYRAGAVLTESRYRFRARVIDVQSGRIVMLIDVSQNTTDAEDIKWTVELYRAEVAQLSSGNRERQNAAIDQILKAVAERMKPRPAGAGLDDRQLCRPTS